MSVKTRKPPLQPRPAAPVPAPPARRPWAAWQWLAVGFGAALLAALIAYWPSMHGAFVFDDSHMQYADPRADTFTLRQWLGGLRQLVGFSYWINYRLGGPDPFGYHLVNVLLHTLAALMVFLIVRKLLELAAGTSQISNTRRLLIAGFCAAIFLLHPVQTEAVAYIAARSEELSVVLAFAAWACFLYRKSPAITFLQTAAVLLLFGASVGAKEHVAVLPAVILLTDYYWNPGFSLQGARRNWRLYGVFIVASLAVAAFFYSYLKNEPTIGFHDVSPFQYFFTECRVLFLYARLFVFHFGLNADYSVELSHTPLEHGAIFGMLALAALSVAAFLWRRRYPLASYGFFVALIFFIPTSTIPIRDLAAERRLYLPMIGLLLIAADFLWRTCSNLSVRQLATAFAVVVAVAGVLTWQRSYVWSTSLALWSDTVEKSPQKPRPHHGLAEADYAAGRYSDADRQFQLVDCSQYNCDGIFYSNWALALNGAGRVNEAKAMGRKAMELHPSAETYAPQSMYLAEDGEIAQALAVLDQAEKYDASYQPIYIYRGDILGQTGRRDAACAAFEKAQTLNPKDPSAYKGLATYQCRP